MFLVSDSGRWKSSARPAKTAIRTSYRTAPGLAFRLWSYSPQTAFRMFEKWASLTKQTPYSMNGAANLVLPCIPSGIHGSWILFYLDLNPSSRRRRGNVFDFWSPGYRPRLPVPEDVEKGEGATADMGGNIHRRQIRLRLSGSGEKISFCFCSSFSGFPNVRNLRIAFWNLHTRTGRDCRFCVCQITVV